MKRILALSLALGLISLSISCAKKDDENHDPAKAVAQEIKYPEIMKNWKSEACIPSSLIPISQTHYKIEYDFHGDSFVKRYNYYTDAACETQVAQISYSGSLDINDSSGEDQFNSKHVDTKFAKVTVRAVNDEGKNFLQLVDLCGQKDFPTGQEVDLTAASTKTLCILQTSNDVVYFDRATIVDGALLMATGYSEKPTNKDANARPDIEPDKNERFVTR